jgi:putative protease
MVLARELDLHQIRAVAAAAPRATLEFFIHGALCVAYSGQCYLSHAHTGRSANRGDCSQPCRLPYTVTDSKGGIVAHDSHVLSMKDNNQTANLEALVDCGHPQLQDRGPLQGHGLREEHHRPLPAGARQLLAARGDLRAASAGRCTFAFVPDPDRNFNRGSTDYFVNGRQMDIGAFDTPKHAGLALGHVTRVAPEHFEVELATPDAELHNGDGLTYYDLQKELVGLQVNVATSADARPAPGEPLAHRAQRAGRHAEGPAREAEIHRNRDMDWDRLLERKSAERTIAVRMTLSDVEGGLRLAVDGRAGLRGERRQLALELQPSRDVERGLADDARAPVQAGRHDLRAAELAIATSAPWFVPASRLNALRREALERLEAARLERRERLAARRARCRRRGLPDDALSYLANVYNQPAHDFYAKHGVKVIEAAYESHEEQGEVSLMITKHCVRWSMSLCPKQAKGVTGVQGTVRAEPLTLHNGSEKLTLRFDCKPCEMHVSARSRRQVLNEAWRCR